MGRVSWVSALVNLLLIADHVGTIFHCLSDSSKPSPAPSSSKSDVAPPPQPRKLSTIITQERTTPRDAKSDHPSGLEPKSVKSDSDKKIRIRGCTMYYDALCFDSLAGE